MDYFAYKNGLYHAEDVPLDVLAREVGTPFYCYSAATLTRHYQVFAGAFEGVPHSICYALKANSNTEVLRVLARLGSGADVVSGGEIKLAQAAGIPPNRIVFSGVGKTRKEMAFALKENIFQFNVESEPELLALNDVAAAQRVKARIAIRINPDVAAGTHAKISTGTKETKFGVPIEQAPALYHLARELPHIEVQGVSLHIGSQLIDLAPFAQAFAHAREFVKQLRGEGFTITTLDLGGGLGIPYGTETPPTPMEYAEIAKRETRELGCTLIFEPGRMLVGNAGILVTRVTYVKRTPTKIFIILDAGMNDLIRPTLYDAYHEILPVREPAAGEKKIAADVVGPVCETGDYFAEAREIFVPKENDLLVLRTAGAYGAAMASTYNARPLAGEVTVSGGNYTITRVRSGF